MCRAAVDNVSSGSVLSFCGQICRRHRRGPNFELSNFWSLRRAVI